MPAMPGKLPLRCAVSGVGVRSQRFPWGWDGGGGSPTQDGTR